MFLIKSSYCEEKKSVSSGFFFFSSIKKKKSIITYYIVLLFPGQLILSLDKDTYEQLGLEGQPSQYNHKKAMRFGKCLYSE